MKDIKMNGPAQDTIVEMRIFNADDENEYDVQLVHTTFQTDNESNWTISGTLLSIVEADD